MLQSNAFFQTMAHGMETELRIPFSSAREAEIVYNSLRVEVEPARSKVGFFGFLGSVPEYFQALRGIHLQNVRPRKVLPRKGPARKVRRRKVRQRKVRDTKGPAAKGPEEKVRMQKVRIPFFLTITSLLTDPNGAHLLIR
jgi:hypothetical protein